jgi:C1A family cysteine protease
MYHKVRIVGSEKVLSTGWIPPMPDLRDYTEEHSQVKNIAEKLGFTHELTLPGKVDLRKWCSEIADQGNLGSCTAHAAAGIVEYFVNRAFTKQIKTSRLFIYKATRNLMGVTGDVGAYLRDTMGALVLLGAPAERYWSYSDKDPDFDVEPPAFVYAIADNYETLQYFCHDSLGTCRNPDEVLHSVKKYIAAVFPLCLVFLGFRHLPNLTSAVEFPTRAPPRKRSGDMQLLQ